MTKVTRVGVRLSDTERQALQDLATTEGCTMSDIVRTALAEYDKRLFGGKNKNNV